MSCVVSVLIHPSLIFYLTDNLLHANNELRCLSPYFPK